MKRVIVIGGGFAGSYIAKKLENKFDLTLIDNKEYFEFTPGILRTIVEPEHIKKIQILHSKYLKKARIVIGSVDEVGRGFVKVNGKKLDFDYLAICAGSSYNVPFKEGVVIATRAKTLWEYSSHLKDAKNVLIIGGGLVGVELAGEICWKYPDKKITIVHSAPRLIQRNNNKAINYAERFLKRKGVEIIFNESVVEFDGIYRADKGRVIEADMAFLCTGIVPNFQLLKKHFSDYLNEKNQIKVNAFLQLEGKKNIFVAGDVNNLVEEKTAQNAERQGKIVAYNIQAIESIRKMKPYKSKQTPMVISLGKYNGIFTSKYLTCSGFLAGITKWIIEKKEIAKKRYF